MEIKTQLKKFRKQEGITQLELAEEVGVSRQTINAIETGKMIQAWGWRSKLRNSSIRR